MLHYRGLTFESSASEGVFLTGFKLIKPEGAIQEELANFFLLFCCSCSKLVRTSSSTDLAYAMVRIAMFVQLWDVLLGGLLRLPTLAQSNNPILKFGPCKDNSSHNTTPVLMLGNILEFQKLEPFENDL